jgi:putative ABC transport system permease protein
MLVLSYRQTWFSLAMVWLSLLTACAGLSAVLLINQSAKQSYSADSANAILSARHQILPIQDSNPISLENYRLIKQQGLSEAIAISTARVTLFADSKPLGQRIDLIGVDVLALLNQVKVSDSQADSSANMQKAPTSANPLQIGQRMGFNQDLTLAHPRLLEELSITEDTVLSLDANMQNRLPRIRSAQLSGLGNELLLDIGVLLSLLPSNDITRILIPSPLNDAQLANIREWLPNHLTITPIEDVQDSAQLTQSFHLNLFAMALLMFAVCLFIVMNACNLLIFKRFAMLKTLRQLGVSRRMIIITHAAELLLFAAVISALGVLVGTQVAFWVAPTIRSILEGLYRVQVGFIDTQWLFLYLKIFMTSVAGLTLALLLPMQQLKQSLATTKSAIADVKIDAPIVSALLFFSLLAICLFAFSNHLGALLLGAAAVILAGSCLLILLFPHLLSVCYRVVSSQYTFLRLGLAQSRALSQKTKIACCAFFIAVTSNLGMNLMVDSFRASTESWLDQRLVADHYLYSDNPAINQQLMPLAKQYSVEVHPRFEKEYEYAGRAVQLFSYPSAERFAQAMVFQDTSANAWQSFEGGKSVFVNQQFTIRNALSLGDEVDIQVPITAKTESFTVAGIIYDYGNPMGQILMPPTLFEQNPASASIFALLGEQANIAAFSDALKTLDIKLDEQLFESAQILSGSMEVFDRTFVITDGLNLVTLLVAALSLACTLVTLIDQSRPQTMLLRALGISAWQGRGLLLLQYMLLCFVALLCATPFGILLSYILIEQINYHAFNWSYPLVIEASKIMQLYGISFMVVFMVISAPIVLSTRKSLAQELTCLD